MDTDAYFDPPDFHKIFTMAEIEALRENTDPNTILIRAFVGGWKGKQSEPIEMAVDDLRKKYGPLGYTILLELLTNDIVRNDLKWGPTELFTGLLAADIHLVPTHSHQGMLSKGGTDSWNMGSILQNYERLQYHLGVPNGKHINCPVWSQNKSRLYEALMELDLCLPTISISIRDQAITENDLEKLVK
jgi:hypothetical protein